MKIVFVIVVIIVLSFILGYLNVNNYLTQFYEVLSFLPSFLMPFLTIYNVMITYHNTMIFIMAFLGAQLIRFVLHKLGVYGDD